jgi:hypothetical protein
VAVRGGVDLTTVATVAMTGRLVLSVYRDWRPIWRDGVRVSDDDRGWAGFATLRLDGVRDVVTLAGTWEQPDEQSARDDLLARPSVQAILAMRGDL